MLRFTKLTNPFKNKSILLQLLLSFTGSALLLILIVGFIFSYLFSKDSLSSINNMAELALSNVCLSVANSFDSSNKSVYDIYNTPNIKNIILSDYYDNNDLYTASLYLNYLRVSTPNLYSIYLYNGKSIPLNIGGNYIESPEEISKLVNSNRILYPPIYRKVKDKSGNLIEFYTYIYTDATGDSKNKPSVIINFKAKDIYNQVYSKFGNPGQDIIITDNHGVILMNRNMDMISDNISNTEFFKIADSQNKEYFSFHSDYKGKDYMINFFSFGGGKYKAFLLSDYNMFFQKTTQIRNTIIIICLLLLLVIIFLSFFFSYNLYSPINNIFSNIKSFLVSSDSNKESNLDIKYISTSIRSIIEKLNDFEIDKKAIKTSFIKEILSTDKHISDDYILDGFSKFDFLDRENCTYSIAIFRIGHAQQFFNNNTITSIHFQFDSIENIILKIIQEGYKCLSCQINDENIMLIISFIVDSSNNISQEKEFINMLKNAQDTIFQLFNIEITIGISNFFSNLTIQEISDNYNEAYNLTNFRLLNNRMSIFMKSTINNEKMHNDIISSYLNFILNLVKEGALEEYKNKLKMLFTEIKHCNYDNVINIFFHLAESIQKISSNLHVFPSSNVFISHEGLYNTIKSFEDYDELEKWFVELFLQTNKMLLGIKGKKAHDYIKNVVEYIEQNYFDFNLSANLMSEKLSFTPQYFSKIFKEYTGYSFPDYVNNIKLEKATELLLQNKNMTISEICEKVGFNNKPYFTNSFTKKYGVSPVKYRQINKTMNNTTHQ